MALHLDRPARRTTDLVSLIRSVIDAGEHDEADWIEWKSYLDLREPEYTVAVARHVLGMANREPERASRHAGGCGYILVGVEPGELAGMDTVDLADLEPRLTKYVGDDGPQWTPQWIGVDGTHVLVVMVEPPSQGDPIHTLRKSYDKYRDGDVFVRRPGRTERASSAEIQMLTARATPPADDRQLRVAVDPGLVAVRGILADEEAIDAYCVIEERRLLSALNDTPEDAPNTAFYGAVGAAHRTFLSAARFGKQRVEEDRSEEEYREQVASYLTRLHEQVVGVAIDELVASDAALVQLRLVNPTNMPFTNVRLDLHFGGEGFSCQRSVQHAELPKPPRIWGDRWVDPMAGLRVTPNVGGWMPADPLPRLNVPSVQIDNSSSSTLTFDEVDLAPHDTAAQPVFHFVAAGHLAGDRIVGEWTARSTAADGTCSGTVVIEIDESPISLMDLLGSRG